VESSMHQDLEQDEEDAFHSEVVNELMMIKVLVDKLLDKLQ